MRFSKVSGEISKFPSEPPPEGEDSRTTTIELRDQAAFVGVFSTATAPGPSPSGLTTWQTEGLVVGVACLAVVGVATAFVFVSRRQKASIVAGSAVGAATTAGTTGSRGSLDGSLLDDDAAGASNNPTIEDL